MKINLNFILTILIVAIFVLIYTDKNIEGIKALIMLGSNLISGFWGYKQGLDNRN